ncbi:MAG: glycosyltransferase [Eggerthellaceae bacterium]
MAYLKGLSGMHFVFLPGRDEEYALHLERQRQAMAIDNMTVMGYVNMPALMAASDLAICKSGGLTVTECRSSFPWCFWAGRTVRRGEYAYAHVARR